jgi:hypothetical protein
MLKIAGILLLIAVWVWMCYDLYNAPLVDEDENIIDKK